MRNNGFIPRIDSRGFFFVSLKISVKTQDLYLKNGVFNLLITYYSC